MDLNGIPSAFARRVINRLMGMFVNSAVDWTTRRFSQRPKGPDGQDLPLTPEEAAREAQMNELAKRNRKLSKMGRRLF